MGSLGNYAENQLLDHLFTTAHAPNADLYLGLSTADPTDDASGIAEPASNYARQIITFDAAAARKVENAALITYPQAGASWGTVSHWFICNHLSNTSFESDVEMLAHGSFATPKAIASGNTASVAAQEVDVEITAGGLANAVVIKLLDLMFREIAYTVPDTYIALLTVNGADTQTGSTITEPSGGAYARAAVLTAAWNAAVAGVVTNNGVIQFATPTTTWGTITDVAICSASSAGDLIGYADLGGDEQPTTDDDVEFADTDLSITLS